MGTTRNFSLNRKFKGEKITVKLKKILEPKLPTTFQAASSQDFTDGEVYQAEFTDQTLTISQRTIFSGCSFKNTTFEFTDNTISEFTDCVFEKCDLSNLNFNKIGIYRSVFKFCKLLGTDFTESHLQDVQFTENLLTYANFSGST